jgi:hypothetical protein
MGTAYDTPGERLVAGLRRLWRNFFRAGDLTIRQELQEFLGHDYDRCQTHDKTFPGYDIASLHRALASFQADCCTDFREVGAVYGVTTLGNLFSLLKQPYQRNLKPQAPTYQRVPVDVDEEESFVTSGLYLTTVRDGTSGREHIAILLAVTAHQYDYWDGMDTRNVPQQHLSVSIACRSREIADRFFKELEERRKRLSIYRGKVIDPVVSGGAVHTIGFRALHKVRAQDLILPEKVKTLIHGSIIGFYDHRDVLQELGIEMKRGILFHGPPGTGKTSISLYLAGLLPSFTVCFVSGERLLYPRELCRMARYLQPSMIVFEDIDLVAQERNATGLATVLGELMNQIDGCEPTDQVLFIMNTNSLERLEHAVKNRPGRVDQIVQIPLPDRQERAQLLTYFARSVRLAANDMAKLLDATEGATPAMLKEIVKRAVVSAIERDGGQVVLEENDLLLATEQVRAMRDPELVPGNFGFRERRG